MTKQAAALISHIPVQPHPMSNPRMLLASAVRKHARARELFASKALAAKQAGVPEQKLRPIEEAARALLNR